MANDGSLLDLAELDWPVAGLQHTSPSSKDLDCPHPLSSRGSGPSPRKRDRSSVVAWAQPMDRIRSVAESRVRPSISLITNSDKQITIPPRESASTTAIKVVVPEGVNS